MTMLRFWPRETISLLSFFEQGFKGFVAALKIAKFPPWDYFRSNLNGDIEDEHPVLMRLRARHWAFEEAFKKRSQIRWQHKIKVDLAKRFDTLAFNPTIFIRAILY